MNRQLCRLLLAATLAALHPVLQAQDADIRKNITARLPGFPKIDEIKKTPVAGLYEVRSGSSVYYTDAKGDHLIQGHITDTKTRVNLTQERLEQLSAVDFSELPLSDALVWKQGNGARKLVVFADPNCGYCKRLEQELQAVKDVTVYTFLYPILGPDSQKKSRSIWCSKDNNMVWRDWMLKGVVPEASPEPCDISSLSRNLVLGQKLRVTGTPAILFEDGTRVPGLMNSVELERQLQAPSNKAITKR